MNANTESVMPVHPRDSADEINCFGCAPGNPIGLQLVFSKKGHSYESRFVLGANYESYPGIIHGGIVATVVDEMMSQVIYRGTGMSIYTVGLRIRYGQPLRTGVAHLASAEVEVSDGATIRASGRIESERGGLVAAATGTFYQIPEDELAQLRARRPAISA